MQVTLSCNLCCSQTKMSRTKTNCRGRQFFQINIIRAATPYASDCFYKSSISCAILSIFIDSTVKNNRFWRIKYLQENRMNQLLHPDQKSDMRWYFEAMFPRWLEIDSIFSAPAMQHTLCLVTLKQKKYYIYRNPWCNYFIYQCDHTRSPSSIPSHVLFRSYCGGWMSSEYPLQVLYLFRYFSSQSTFILSQQFALKGDNYRCA